MNGWSEQMDNYCERVDFAFWSEPVNALTNAAFLLAAFLVWRALKGPDLGARLLVGVLAAIGIGSFLFHTFATRWAVMMDVLPILTFILLYVHLATIRFFGAPVWAGIGAAVAYIPYSAVVTIGLSALTGPLNGSIAYFPVPILITAYALALLGRAPDTARGLLIGVGLLTLSLFFRTIDQAVCPQLGLGTHFLWHCLNGAMLGWMIWVLHRARAPHPPAPN
ncbi:MAG: ceramidase domain-containing protein [Pseudomonadota bacterium]